LNERPIGYLRGFIDPARQRLPQPLWYFNKPNGLWSNRSPREVGYRCGFYDYTVAESGAETADTAFAELERTFPKVRKELVRKNFKNWKHHLAFLLRYAQMMQQALILVVAWLEARVGIEPTNEGFADLSLPTWVPRLGRTV
jgi:hypothetical protein